MDACFDTGEEERKKPFTEELERAKEVTVKEPFRVRTLEAVENNVSK